MEQIESYYIFSCFPIGSCAPDLRITGGMVQPWVAIIRGSQAHVAVRWQWVPADRIEAYQPEPTPVFLHTGGLCVNTETANAQLPAWYAKPIKYGCIKIK